jgi:hypothetical protein
MQRFSERVKDGCRLVSYPYILSVVMRLGTELFYKVVHNEGKGKGKVIPML